MFSFGVVHALSPPPPPRTRSRRLGGRCGRIHKHICECDGDRQNLAREWPSSPFPRSSSPLLLLREANGPPRQFGSALSLSMSLSLYLPLNCSFSLVSSGSVTTRARTMPASPTERGVAFRRSAKSSFVAGSLDSPPFQGQACGGYLILFSRVLKVRDHECSHCTLQQSRRRAGLPKVDDVCPPVSVITHELHRCGGHDEIRHECDYHRVSFYLTGGRLLRQCVAR